MVYFTQLLKKEILDKGGKNIGRLTDLVFKDGEKCADITHLLVSIGGECKKISWDCVREMIEMIDRISITKVDVDIVLTKK